MLRLRFTAPLALLLAAPLTACNGDGSRAGAGTYDGTYMVTSHSRNDTSCDAPLDPVVDGYEYFQLEQTTLFGQPMLAWHDCDSATSCESDISLTGSFVTIDGEWRMRSSYSSGGTDCLVGLNDGTIENTADGIRIEIRRYSGSFTVATEDDCQPELAEERMDELTCESLEVVEATSI